MVFTCSRPPQLQICIVNADGTHERQLTTKAWTASGATWSSDGRHIAFVADSRRLSDQETGVYIMDENGTNQRRISKLWAWSVSWSPDGKNLLIRASDGAYIVNVEGNYGRKLSLGPGRALDEVFSPDGRDVVYRSNEEGKGKICAINVDGTGRRRLSDDAGEDSAFAISPLLRH